MKKIVFAALIICMSITAQAQISNYLAPGKSGLGIQVVGEKAPTFQGFGGMISGTYKGKVDLSLMGTSDVYGKENNNLLTDQANGHYVEGKVTWWVFRNEISPMIDVSFGVFGGFTGTFYNDFQYLSPTSGKTVDFTHFLGGIAGLTAAANLKLSENWMLQPSYTAYYDFGNDYETESGIESTSGYSGVISGLSLSLIRRIGEGNAFVLTASTFFQTYETAVFNNLTAGYIFSF